jgi:hypothetical protein
VKDPNIIDRGDSRTGGQRLISGAVRKRKSLRQVASKERCSASDWPWESSGPPSSPMRSRTTCSTGRLRRLLSICTRLMTSPPSCLPCLLQARLPQTVRKVCHLPAQRAGLQQPRRFPAQEGIGPSPGRARAVILHDRDTTAVGPSVANARRSRYIWRRPSPIKVLAASTAAAARGQAVNR